MVNQTKYGVALPEQIAGMTGLEFIDAMAKGKLPRPPMSQRIPLHVKSYEAGKLTLKVVADDTYLNPGGIVHGGLALTALDTAMGLAVHTSLGRGKGFASIDTAVRFHRPLRGGVIHELEAIGEMITKGRTIATARGELRTLSGKLIASGTSGCAIHSIEPNE